MSELEWLLTNIDRISVGGLFAFALVALYRGWIVLGSTYRECRDVNTKLETAVDRYIEEDRQEKAELRRELALLRQNPPRRRSS